VSYDIIRGYEERVKVLESKVREAIKKARGLGTIIGRVSRRRASLASGSDTGLTIQFEIDPQTYFNYRIAVNDYLVAVDIGSLKTYGIRVKSISRVDVISESSPPISLPLDIEPEGLITPTIVDAEPLLSEEGEPLLSPIEPQSPVVIPKDPELIVKVTGLPTEGVVLGVLLGGLEPVANGTVPVRLPRSEFFKHVLIVGTTGSGKTTLIKNIIYAMQKDWADVGIVIIDAAGDYTQIAIPPLTLPSDANVIIKSREDYLSKYPKYFTILTPVTREFKSIKEFVETFITDRYEKILDLFHGRKLEYELSPDEGRNLGYVKSVIVDLKVRADLITKVEIIPIALNYEQLKPHLNIIPLFSRQARIYLDLMINYLEKVGHGINSFERLQEVFVDHRENIHNYFKIHRSTLDNIERVFKWLAGTEISDVVLENRQIKIPPADMLMRDYRGPIILDLDYGVLQGVQQFALNLLAYEFLRSMYEWKKFRAKIFDRPSVVIFDEAHRFFPAEGTSGEEVEVLADFISMIARLGRSRGLGLIFSTHSPRDVHKIIIQLSNTKVILRTEKAFIEDLQIPPEYARFLMLAPDREGVLRSSAIRSGYVTFKTSEPLMGHYDIGRASIGELHQG